MKTKKKNNNKITLFTIFAIIITIIALIATSGTYAKYTSSVTTDTATATIAKWEVLIGEDGLNMYETSTIEFNIFDEIKDSDLISTETEVKQPTDATAKRVIAPGTSGNKNLKIVNKSDVDIDLTIDFVSQTGNPNIPIKFGILDSDADSSSVVFYTPTDFQKVLSGEITDANTRRASYRYSC